ncbi:hypothetical protein GCM10009619_21000 [Williamsia maris]
MSAMIASTITVNRVRDIGGRAKIACARWASTSVIGAGGDDLAGTSWWQVEDRTDLGDRAEVVFFSFVVDQTGRLQHPEVRGGVDRATVRQDLDEFGRVVVLIVGQLRLQRRTGPVCGGGGRAGHESNIHSTFDNRTDLSAALWTTRPRGRGAPTSRSGS